jgi:TatA/E family protein of Tat protein translocase
MPNIGFTELLVILAIALLLFGNRLPNVGKALGEGIRNFKKGLEGGDDASKAPQQSAQQSAQQTPPAQQPISAQPVQPGTLHSAQNQQQAKLDYVDVEHRDTHK